MKSNRKRNLIILGVVLLIIIIGVYIFIKNNEKRENKYPAYNTEELYELYKPLEIKKLNKDEIIFSDKHNLNENEKIDVWVYSKPTYLGSYNIIIENKDKKIKGFNADLKKLSLEAGKHDMVFVSKKNGTIGYVEINIGDDGIVTEDIKLDEVTTTTKKVETTTTGKKTSKQTTTKKVVTTNTTTSAQTTQSTSTTTKVIDPLVGKWYATKNQCSVANGYFDKEKNEYVSVPPVCKDYKLVFEFKENGEFYFNGEYVNRYSNNTIIYKNINGQSGNNPEVKYYLDNETLYINLYKMPQIITETEVKDISVVSLGAYPITASK